MSQWRTNKERSQEGFSSIPTQSNSFQSFESLQTLDLNQPLTPTPIHSHHARLEVKFEDRPKDKFYLMKGQTKRIEKCLAPLREIGVYIERIVLDPQHIVVKALHRKDSSTWNAEEHIITNTFVKSKKEHMALINKAGQSLDFQDGGSDTSISEGTTFPTCVQISQEVIEETGAGGLDDFKRVHVNLGTGKDQGLGIHECVQILSGTLIYCWKTKSRGFVRVKLVCDDTTGWLCSFKGNTPHSAELQECRFVSQTLGPMEWKTNFLDDMSNPLMPRRADFQNMTPIELFNLYLERLRDHDSLGTFEMLATENSLNGKNIANHSQMTDYFDEHVEQALAVKTKKISMSPDDPRTVIFEHVQAFDSPKAGGERVHKKCVSGFTFNNEGFLCKEFDIGSNPISA